jgi:outer membrane protein assembly factor BamB
MIDQTPDRLATDMANSGGQFIAQLVDGATSFGDDSLTFQIQDVLDAGNTYGYRVYVKVGSDVARLQIDSSNDLGIGIDNIEAVAAAESACLQAGSCAAAEQQPVSLPGLDCPPTHEGDLVTDYAYAEIAPSPMFGVDPTRSGAQPGPAPTGEPTGLWTVDVHAGLVTGPVISDGLLVFGSSEVTPPSDPDDPFASPTESDYLFAFDPTSGFKWCAPTGNAIADPSLDNGLVFTEASAIAGQHQQTSVVALDAETGVARWQFPIGPSVESYRAAVTATDGSVYVTTGMGTIFALDEETGNPRWLYQVEQGDDMTGLTLSYPAISDGAVYVTGGTTLYALNAETGEELWDVSADDESEVLGTPSVANGIVYVGGEYAIYAVDAQTGDEQWVMDADSPGGTSVAVVDGVVYTAGGSETDPSIAGFVSALSADTGSKIWHLDLKGYATTPQVVDDVVYVGAGATQPDGTVAGGILGFSTADGTVVMNTAISGAVTRPVITGGAIYIASTSTTPDGQQGTLTVIGGDSAPVDSTPILDRKSG